MMNLIKKIGGLSALFLALGIGSEVSEASAAHAAARVKKTRGEEKYALLSHRGLNRHFINEHEVSHEQKRKKAASTLTDAATAAVTAADAETSKEADLWASVMAIKAGQHFSASLKTKLMFRAIIGGFEDIVRELLACGVGIDFTYSKAPLLLSYVVMRGTHSMLDLILPHLTRLIDTPWNGNTPLQWAVIKNKKWMVNLFLAHYANITKPNAQGKTALALAKDLEATEDRDEEISLAIELALLAQEADATSVTPDSMSASAGSLAEKKEAEEEYGEYAAEIVERLFAQQGHITDDDLIALQSEGISLDIPDEKGLTAYHYLASTAPADLLQELIPFLLPTDVDYQDKESGRGILHRLVSRDEPEIVIIVGQLLKFIRDCNVNLLDQEEKMPLDYAVEKDNVPMATMLVAFGATAAARADGLSLMELARSEEMKALLLSVYRK